MPPYRHIIWDWNGTLLDDAETCVSILNEMLAARNRQPITAMQYAEQFGFPVEAFYQVVGFDFASEPYPEVARAFMEIYDSRRFACSLRAGAREALDVFAKLGLEQSILSAYKSQSLQESADYFNLRSYFSALRGLSDNLAASKLENGRRLAADLDCLPEQALLVGDTTHDAEVARATGLRCALVHSGHQSIPRLKATGVPVFSSLHELVASVREKCGE